MSDILFFMCTTSRCNVSFAHSYRDFPTVDVHWAEYHANKLMTTYFRVVYVFRFFLVLAGNCIEKWRCLKDSISYLYTYYTLQITAYKSVIFPVNLYWYKNWSPVLMEEQWLLVFYNRVVSSTSGSKRDDGTAGRRALNNKELHNLYPSPRVIIWVWNQIWDSLGM
jgi:hypothetical protein